VEYCPTEEMLANLFTKPLQGAAFRRFRDAVLNIDSLDADRSASSLAYRSQECVGESVNGLSNVGNDDDVIENDSGSSG
jgi:hypothetical protein